MYRATLSGGEALLPTATGAGGAAVIKMAADGSMSYRIHLAGLGSSVTAITLEGETNKRGQIRIVTNMIASYDNGWVEGVFDKQNAREVEALLAGNLFINVATGKYEDGEIRGRVVAEFMADHKAGKKQHRCRNGVLLHTRIKLLSQLTYLEYV